jgi:hypothetical protein
MRDVLEKIRRDFDRLRPMVDRAMNGFAAAFAAFASEIQHVDSDRRDHGPVPHLQGGAGRGRTALPNCVACEVPQPREVPPTNPHFEQVYGPRVRGLSGSLAGSTSRGACSSSPRPSSAVCAASDTPESAGPSVGGSLRTVAPALEASAAAHRARFAPPAPLTAIEPAPRALRPTPEAVEHAKARIANRAAAKELADRRAQRLPLSQSKAEPNPNARERWTASEIAVETSQAEIHKRDGALPGPRSSFIVTPRTGGDVAGDLASVVEVVA